MIIESEQENMKLNENEDKNNKEIGLEKYIIISKYYNKDDQEEEKNENNIFLPSLESFQKICNQKLVKDVINFDFKKYNSYFQKNMEENSLEEKNILNLDKISSLNNEHVLPYLVLFLGGLNSMNSIYDILGDSSLLPKEKYFIENNLNYLDYLNNLLEYIKEQDKNEGIFFSLKDLEILLQSLDELGINIPKNDNNIFYCNLKYSILSFQSNKILILIAPSNNFWIKSDKTLIGEEIYDKQLNNYTRIFYNKKFIKNFFNKVTKHSRCKFGLISSMLRYNVLNCWEGLKILNKESNDLNPIFIDQDMHIRIPYTHNFYRNMNKIKKHLKNIKKNYFDEKNIIILESETNKVGPDTKNNSIIVNLFNEEYIENYHIEMSRKEDKGDEVIKYIIDLLENCSNDIRDFINKNKTEFCN